ncbi:MAG: MucB/RseB C-terminal domain-containing protein [Pseudomonadota bacterium]
MKLLVAPCGKLLGGLLLAVAANAYAGESQSCLDWLKTVAFAGHQTDYTGVFVYQYDNRVETSRITHLAEADGEYEKIESLDGPRREIVRHHGQVWSYINHKMVQVDSHQGHGRFPSLLPDQLSRLGLNYQPKQAGTERVAGYDAQVIVFQPKDNLRYTHKIWVHTDSGLLLKAAVLTDKNQVVEQYAFTQLQIGGKIDRSWMSKTAASARKQGLSAGASGSELPEPGNTGKPVAPTSSGWVADAIPPGFQKTMEILRPMHGKHAPVTQIVYTDGLSAISIFIEPDDGDEDDVTGLSSRGAVNLYHKVSDSHLITVVGEVPPRTVMQVFDSVRFNGK